MTTANTSCCASNSTSRLHSADSRRPSSSRRLNAARLRNAKVNSGNPFRERKPDGSALNATIRLAQQGDAAAFEELYKLNSRRVYALCLRMVSDPCEAEDLAQEAFLQLFRKIHTFRGESAFSSWLHRLTANVVLMSFRKKKTLTTSLDEISHTSDDDAGHKIEIGVPDLRLAGVFDRVNLQAAIDQLPEGYRKMFLLHDLHGYEHNEIAEILDCSIGNSKSQVHKARKRLREALNKIERYRSRNLNPAQALAPASSI
jgi:RNA polymerase sigma-70 factor (ECF subfamily)